MQLKLSQVAQAEAITIFLTEQKAAQETMFRLTTAGSTTAWVSAIFTMDLRADRIAADGFSVGFLDMATHGASGVVQVGTTGLGDVEERGQYSNSIGVGFRTFNGSNATVNYNGVESAEAVYTLTGSAWGSMQIQLDRNPLTNEVLLDATLVSVLALLVFGSRRRC